MVLLDIIYINVTIANMLVCLKSFYSSITFLGWNTKIIGRKTKKGVAEKFPIVVN